MSETNPTDLPAGLLRIGTVSRLAGIPVSTLRIWEQRYGAFTPDKTQGSHRLYAEGDLVRARLLRRLTEAGHGIRTIATLPQERLQALLAQAGDAPAPRRQAGAPSAVVLGSPLAARLLGGGWRHRWQGQPLQVRQVVLDLRELEALAAQREPGAAAGADLLLVRLTAVQPDVPARLLQACQALGITRAIVLYGFAAQATVDALRGQGMLARREPVGDEDLAQLLDAVLLADPGTGSASAVIPARRYSDEVLQQVAQAPSSVLCECPRHIADLLVQLASFEDYSEQCLHRNEDDARLHAYLRSVAGSARAMFEQALERVAGHAGVALDG